MADTFQVLDSCSIVGSNSIAFGSSAGAAHTAAATGGTFLGHRAGIISASGPSNFSIGANSGTGATSGDCIAVGNGSTVSHASAASMSIAVGSSAVVSSLNSLIIGSADTATTGSVIQEFGGHQYFWTLTTTSSSLVLTGTTGAASILGGWIAFEGISANCTLTLPTLTNMLAVLPTIIEGSTGELILSNFNSGGWQISVVSGTDTYWYNTDAIGANMINHVYYRYVNTSGWQQATPFIEFFS